MPLIIKLAPPGQHIRAPDPGSAWQDAGGPGLLVQPAKDGNAVRSDLKFNLIYLAKTPGSRLGPGASRPPRRQHHQRPTGASMTIMDSAQEGQVRSILSELAVVAPRNELEVQRPTLLVELAA